MSVIGRLDKQVEEMIINPLAKRAPSDKASDATSGTDADLPHKEDERPKEKPATARDDSDQALPVWLL